MRNANAKIVIEKISKNAKIDEEIVKNAYNHVFINKHNLEKGYTYFEEDYEMAESWRRLRTNDNIQKHDKILLLHENLESIIMSEDPNISYDEAHAITNKSHNYEKALDE